MNIKDLQDRTHTAIVNKVLDIIEKAADSGSYGVVISEQQMKEAKMYLGYFDIVEIKQPLSNRPYYHISWSKE